MPWKLRAIERLRLLKARLLRRSDIARLIVPLVEVAEFTLSHGVGEVIVRSRIRLFGHRSAPVQVPVLVPLSRPSLGGEPLRVPQAPNRPHASVVVYGAQDAATLQACLASVIEHTPAGTYEVVVASAEDEVTSWCTSGHVEGLAAVVSATPHRWTDLRNQGAAVGSGDILVFLDACTQVTNGWLPPLLDLLSKDQANGLVGGRRLRHDGRLLNAGELVWQDGTCEVYGYDADASAPEFAFVREVDAISPNGLAIHRHVFEQVKGFAPAFQATAFAGADLCFRARALGYRALYQPLSTLVEPPSATPAETTGRPAPTAGLDAFVAQHAQALSQQHDRRTSSARRARDRRPGQEVLVVDHIVPLHDQDSGSVRMAAILRMLGELGHHVTFLPDNLYGIEPYTTELRQSGVEVICGDHGANYVPTHASDFDVAILCRAPFAPKYLASFVDLPRRPLLIFDTVDLHFVREERHAALEGSAELADLARKTRETELGIMRACDRVWVTSTFESSLLQAEKPLPPVDIVPNVHSVHEGGVPAFADREHFLFIGGFWHAPNEDAVMWFVNDIFPLVHAELPEAKFFVVGSNMPLHISGLTVDGVVPLGHVPDVAPLFASCRLSIAPLRYGAGVKGKVTQSLSLGLPVVATSIAAEGLDLVDGEHIAVADDPAAFARRLVEVYRSETVWTRLSARGRQHIAQRLGYEAVKASVGAMIDGHVAQDRRAAGQGR